MTETPKVVAARIEVARKRAALIDTAHQLQARLAPATLASEAWDKARNKGADLAEDAVDAVRERPVAAGGIAAAIALFLAREPIKDAAGRIYGAMTSPKPKKRGRASENVEFQVELESGPVQPATSMEKIK